VSPGRFTIHYPVENLRVNMAAPSELVGQTLGHYKIQELIGAGGMGFVYRAHDNRLDRSVAVKVLPPGTLHSDQARRRFRHEALALARLNHPNIAVVHDFDSQEGTDFLVMEFVPGLSLADKLAVSRTLPEKQIYSIGQQIARALDCAHTAGIVHRDLKPGNIMLSASGDVKLLDFGLSVLLSKVDGDALQRETVTAAQRVTGTLLYMSPEQLRGEAVDGRCDIYALGVVLYEMATGRAPFESKASGALIDDILHAPVPAAKDQEVSPGLKEIILKCLEKDPDHRYQSARELLVDLQRTATASVPIQRVTGTTRAARRVLRQKRGLLLTAASLAVLMVAAFLAGRWREMKRAPQQPAELVVPARIQSIAVLPLENLSGDPKQEYFADGMTEELIGALTKISSLRVISRTSAMQYKGVHKPLPEIARELHVDAIVEGSVARVEKTQQVRISAQLIDAGNDRSLWSESYERRLGDVFGLQDEVARSIAREIRAQLTPEDQQRLANARPVNSAAHEAYLKGRYEMERGTEEAMRAAKRHFEEAIAVDPNYAPPYTGLADYYWSSDEVPRNIASPKAKQFALKALSIDDTLAAAHTTLGGIRFYLDWDWEGADKEFKAATQLSPGDSESHRLYSVFLSQMGRDEEARREIRIAQGLDPISVATSETAGWVFYYARKYDGAIEQCRQSLQLDPNAVSAHECLSSSYVGRKEYDKAIAEARLIAGGRASDPLRLTALGRAYAAAGRTVEANDVLRTLSSATKARYVSPYFLAIIYSALDDKARAFQNLRRSYLERDSYLVRMKVDDSMDNLRSDPRFAELMGLMKLSPNGSN